MQDEEINFLLGLRASVYGTAAECCRSLAAKFGRSVDQQAGTSKIAYSQLSKAYTSKAMQFEAKAALFGAGMPYAGGISVSDKMLQEMNQDRVTPQYDLGMDDNFLPVSPQGNETIDNSPITGGQ